MTRALMPAIWLIVLVVGLPQLSETVYTPSLPDIAQALGASESMVEYTLTIYLFGFALGTLFWGRISDHYGRKPCVLAGLIIFSIACLSCYFSQTIEMLMISRLVQAFGGSIGSILGQSICRDAFQGPQLGKVYAFMGSALALFPAIGPVCGGMIAQHFGWPAIFVFLLICALIVMILIMAKLPETHPKNNRNPVSMLRLLFRLMSDKKVIGYGLIVAGCNGISFSYFAEGSFYLIKGLGLSPSKYGLSFMLIAIATMIGGMLSRKLHGQHSAKNILKAGLIIMSIASAVFSVMVILNQLFNLLGPGMMVMLTLVSQMTIAFGICMATSNALALALVEYKHAIGTASSLFGFFYYVIISAFTLGMGFLHNGTLLIMPIYFFGICMFMLFVYYLLLRDYDYATLGVTQQNS